MASAPLTSRRIIFILNICPRYLKPECFDEKQRGAQIALPIEKGRRDHASHHPIRVLLVYALLHQSGELVVDG